METSVVLASSHSYEQKKAAAIAAGLLGRREVVFTDEVLLRRWADALEARPESLEKQSCKPAPS